MHLGSWPGVSTGVMLWETIAVISPACSLVYTPHRRHDPLFHLSCRPKPLHCPQISPLLSLLSGMYAALSATQVVFTAISQYLARYMSLLASRRLHDAMIARLVRAPMSFFNITPLGRIVNRLTKDTSELDKNLTDYSAFFMRSVFQLASTVILGGLRKGGGSRGSGGGRRPLTDDGAACAAHPPCWGGLPERVCLVGCSARPSPDLCPCCP